MEQEDSMQEWVGGTAQKGELWGKSVTSQQCFSWGFPGGEESYTLAKASSLNSQL